MARLNAIVPFAADMPAAVPEPSLRLNVLAGFAVIVMFFTAFMVKSAFSFSFFKIRVVREIRG